MKLVDKIIETISPEMARNREIARTQLQVIKNWSSGTGYAEYGASHERNALKGWMTNPASADEDIVENLETLRSRSRDLFMGSPLATGVLKSLRTSVVGSGLMLNAQIDAKFLGMSDEEAREWEEKTEREWRLWAESVECDAERKLTFYQLQSLAFLSALMSGDVFVSLPIVKHSGSVYDLRVCLIEADRVCNPMNITAPEADILGGVEIGKHGEALAYWIANRNPNSFPRATQDGGKLEWERVPAVGRRTGRRNILHVMADAERPGQRRGVPLLAPVIETLKQLQRYSDAELMAAVVSGMFSVFITTDAPNSPIQNNLVPGRPQQGQGNRPANFGLGNGSIVSLKPGEKIEVANPGRPNTAFDGFVTALCRYVGAAVEMPYEVLLKHFSSSYSASRGALLEFWKAVRMHREWLVGSFNQPIYEEFLTEAVLKGRIQAPGFFDDPAIKAAWCGAEWFGDCQGQLDPLKEANAAKVRVEEGFSTREREAAELTGLKFEHIHSVRKREEDMRRADGLTSGAPVLVDAPDDNDEDDDSDDKE